MNAIFSLYLAISPWAYSPNSTVVIPYIRDAYAYHTQLLTTYLRGSHELFQSISSLGLALFFDPVSLARQAGVGLAHAHIRTTTSATARLFLLAGPFPLILCFYQPLPNPIPSNRNDFCPSAHVALPRASPQEIKSKIGALTANYWSLCRSHLTNPP